jgi:hypothetical protein
MDYRKFLCLIVVLESTTQVIISWNTVGTNEASDATRMRQQRHDLECTPGAFEGKGREFESLRAHHCFRAFYSIAWGIPSYSLETMRRMLGATFA